MNHNPSEEKNHITVNLAEPSLSNGNWKTIDFSVLYDKDKCDLTECPLDDVFRILE